MVLYARQESGPPPWVIGEVSIWITDAPSSRTMPNIWLAGGFKVDGLYGVINKGYTGREP